jgi:Uma2 family endonuclease
MSPMDQDVLRTRPVEYPESDGKPVGETEEHFDEIVEANTTLKDHFAGDPEVYVASDHFIYFREGEPTEVVCPDLYVVRGVPKLPDDGQKRRTYKVWENGGKTPCFVLEVTSKSTRREDAGDKMAIYRDDLRVAEYFLFDLSRDWVTTGLRGYRLEEGVYLPIEPDAAGRVRSEQLGLDLSTEGRHLRFHRFDGRPVLSRAERLRAAEDENRRLREELERLRGGW